MRPVFLLAFSLLPFSCWAQLPDVRAKVDISLTGQYQNDGSESLRLYTPLGRPSVVSLSLLLDSGYRVLIGERLQRLPGDAEGDIFDEVYLEDPGIFRVGKQYLPFGAGRLLHESVLGARIDSNLIAENLPIALTLVNAGDGRQNGGVVRIGRSVAFSLAAGEHFGISGTSLGVIRQPDEAPGRGGGWGFVVGADATRRLGKLTLSGEFAAFSTGPQPDLQVGDLEATYASDGYRSIGLGYTLARGRDTFRVFGRVHAARSLDLEPMLRFRGGELYDASVTLRLRL